MSEDKSEAKSVKPVKPVKPDRPIKLLIRNAIIQDIDDINQVIEKSYGAKYPEATLRGQISNYADGCFVAVLDDQIVGYCATIIVSESIALSQHSWKSVTGAGFGTTHKADGDYLYGYEVCVNPDFRRYRIGQRFYKARKRLCEELNKKGIVFCGRLPNLRKRWREVASAEDYLNLVLEQKIRDQVIGFQLRNGFEILGLIENYLPSDHESMGYGLHLIWKNTKYKAPDSQSRGTSGRMPDTVRVATVQYQQRRVTSFEQFERQVRYFVDVCADYRSDFVVFPEFFTLQLLSIENEAILPKDSIRAMCKYEQQVIDMFRDFAIKFNINIIGGSTPSLVGDEVQNVAHVFLRDGSVFSQPKIHPTPNESYWWNIRGGSSLNAIPTDCGPIGVLICYDSEFPELARHLVNQGVLIVFVPFLTDERQSYSRVRYCSQARAVENQVFVVLSGSCGNLPNVNNIDIHYAQSCILSPCDFAFARDGIAADTTPNVETVAFADININALMSARQRGTVRNLLDRRHDLYHVEWTGE